MSCSSSCLISQSAQDYQSAPHFSKRAKYASGATRDSPAADTIESGRMKRPGRLAVLLAAALAANCGGEKPVADSQSVKVGFFGALTGPTATFATSGRNGAMLAAEEV